MSSTGVRLIAAEMAEALRKNASHNLAWAYRLRDRERRQGPKCGAGITSGLTVFQRNAWRIALRKPLDCPAHEPDEVQA